MEMRKPQISKRLINKVKEQVQSKTGVALELEIKIIGDEI